MAVLGKPLQVIGDSVAASIFEWRGRTGLVLGSVKLTAIVFLHAELFALLERGNYMPHEVNPELILCMLWILDSW